MPRSNQEFIAHDRVVVNLDRAESAIVAALDEQADRDHNAVIKLKRVDAPPLGLRLGRVIFSEAPMTQDIERRLEEAGIVLSQRDSRLLRSGGVMQPRLVVELEDVSEKNESAEREYVRDDANATWRLSTMDAEVSVFTSDVDNTTGDVLSKAHNRSKLWLKRQGETEFRNTCEYVMVPGATEASLRAASTHVSASAPATSAAEEENSDDDLLNLSEDNLRDQIAQLKAENAELRGGEVDADAASSDEARPRASVSQIKVGRGDELRYGPDPEDLNVQRDGRDRITGGSVDVPMKPPKLKFVFYSTTLHKGAISLVPEVTWPPFEEILPESISNVPAPLDVIETLDKNKARGLLEDLLTRMLPVFAADGSDDMALLAQAHHLSPVVLHYLNSLLKNIARTLYDGIRELPYDALDLLGTLKIDTDDFWDLVNARDDRVLEKLRDCLERLVSSPPDPEEEPEPKRQRRPSSPRAFDDERPSATERDAEKQEAKKKAMNELRIKVVKLLLEHLVDEARKRFKDDAYSTVIWRKPGWKIKGITLAKLMNRWREGRDSSHGFPWLFDILGIVNFGENPTTKSVAFQWVKAVMHALFDWHPYLDVCVQCRKRAISALARVRGLPLFDQNPECRAAQEPYWMRIFVGSPIYMAGTAPGRIFLFKAADSLSGVTDVTFTATDFAQLERGECVKGCYALCFCCHCCYPLEGNSYYVVILHPSQKSVATVVADLLARTFYDGSSPVLGENCHCFQDFRSYLYGALRTGNATGEFLWHVCVKGAMYGDLPNTMPAEALEEDDDAEPAVPNPEEEDLSAPPDAPHDVVSAVVAQQVEAQGATNVVIDEGAVVERAPASDEQEDVVDPVDELISTPLPVGAPLWAPEVRSLLKEVKDMPLSQISLALQDCGFSVKTTWTSLHARPPADFPCFNELVGKNNSRGYSDVVRSKTQLVDYLRIALERVHDRKEVQLESARREELAAGSQGGNPGNILDTDALSGADVAEDVMQSVGASQPEASVTAKRAQSELLKHPKALLKGDPNAEAKCDAALGNFERPILRGKFESKRQTLKSLCKHQCAFHMVYGADASPTALDGPSEEWFEQKEGEDYLRPKIVFEDKSDIESDEVVKEFERRDALIAAGGFPVNLVTLAVAMGDEPQVPRVPSTSYSSTRDATIVKLRKEIRDKANDRERKLREAYKRNGFGPTPMDTVDG